tara:strand:+ start:546 stop:740 length:195 start_codon:yes stop_codon:yes gene_type:complete
MSYLIYSLFKDDVVRFKHSKEIVVYDTLKEAKDDAYGLGPGFFVHSLEDAMKHHKEEVKNQKNG